MNDSLRRAYEDGIVNLYLKYLRENHKDPTSKEFSNYLQFSDVDRENGVTSWKQIFKNISEVRAMAMVGHEDEISELTFNEEDFRTADYQEQMQEAIRTHKRFIVSTAVNNKPVDMDFLASLKNYARKNDALMLWVPAHDVRSAKRVFQWNFDPALKCGFVITKDTAVNENCMISGIVASAKQLRPLTGIARFCSQFDKTIVFPGCKFLLQGIARMSHVQTPHKAITPGAVTLPDYSSDQIIAGRTNYIAERDHQIGAAIIEIEDNKRFHIRLVQAAEDGSFIDLNVKYNPDDTIESAENTTFVLGDSHVGGTDVPLLKAILSLCRDSNVITELVLHDIDNSASVSHHEENDLVKRVLRNKEGSDDLKAEVNEVVEYLNQLTELPNMNITVVNSNHDRHIERWVREGRAFNNRDYKNMGIFFKLGLAMFEKDVTNPVQFLVENIADVQLNHPDKIKWLGRDESYKKYGVELGVHGDEGANGGRGSLRTYANTLYKAVVAHSHSGGILHNIVQVGTTSKFDMGYNHGLSSWSHSCCLVYNNGTTQLIEFIPNEDGEYTYHA